MNKSLVYIKRKLKRTPDLGVSQSDFPRFFVTGDYVKNGFRDKRGDIWNEEKGMELELRDKDTGNVRLVTIYYKPDADFNLLEVDKEFGYEDDPRGGDNYTRAFAVLVERILWGGIDICPLMPDDYDLDTDKANYKKYLETLPDGEPFISVEEKFKDVHETYFDYDVNYYIGDFVCFKDSKESYKLEAKLSGKMASVNETKQVNRYLVMLPIQVEYVPNWDRKGGLTGE